MFQDVREWFQPHWTSYGERRTLGPIQNSTNFHNFQDFKIGKIAMFPLDSIMYEGMELTFNQGTKPFMYLDVGGIDC